MNLLIPIWRLKFMQTDLDTNGNTVKRPHWLFLSFHILIQELGPLKSLVKKGLCQAIRLR